MRTSYIKSFNLNTSKNSIEIKKEKVGRYVFRTVKKKRFRKKKNLDVCVDCRLCSRRRRRLSTKRSRHSFQHHFGAKIRWQRDCRALVCNLTRVCGVKKDGVGELCWFTLSRSMVRALLNFLAGSGFKLVQHLDCEQLNYWM